MIFKINNVSSGIIIIYFILFLFVLWFEIEKHESQTHWNMHPVKLIVQIFNADRKHVLAFNARRRSSERASERVRGAWKGEGEGCGRGEEEWEASANTWFIIIPKKLNLLLASGASVSLLISYLFSRRRKIHRPARKTFLGKSSGNRKTPWRLNPPESLVLSRRTPWIIADWWSHNDIFVLKEIIAANESVGGWGTRGETTRI
jgi:hypothetical protein